jgi:inosose dehydratase
MLRYTRRRWFGCAAALAAAGLRPGPQTVAQEPRGRGPGFGPGFARTAQGLTLSIGTYSLKGIPLEDAITRVSEMGYDAIEIATQPGFDGEPARLTPERRAEVRRRLEATGLRLTALMEQITPTADDEKHLSDLGRLRRVLALARSLSPRRPPLVQTVLGGGTWEEKKELFRDRMGDWAEAALQTRVVLAIKPHRGGAMSRPEEAIWLIQQLDTATAPWLRMVYDYSHYAFRDMPLEETVKTALPYTAHVVVKDAVREGDRVVFALPGSSGTFDYPRLLRLFYDGGYRGDVCCEVSSQISNKPGYDALAAARTSYDALARAFEQANVPRDRRVPAPEVK